MAESSSKVEAQRAKGPIEIFLSVVAEVKPGEGLAAIVLTFDVLLLLTAYQLLKTVREPLILASGGVAGKNVATIMQAVVLMIFVPLYALVTKRLSRMTLLTATHIFFASNLVLFWVLARFEPKWLATAFFVWLGCFSLVIIAQFWSLANDLYTPEQGKRLFAIIGIGASAGAVAGSKLADVLLEADIDPFKIMLMSAGMLVVCLGLSWLGTKLQGGAQAHKSEDKPIGGKSGFALILGNRYLLLIAAVIMVLNVVNTNGESILDRAQFDEVARINPDYTELHERCDSCEKIEDADAKKACEADVKDACKKSKDMVKDFVGPFRARFGFWVNLVGFITQIFLVSRIFKYAGIRIALFSLPLIGLIGYGGMVGFASLAFIRVMKIAENSTDYSLYNTTKQALWLPTSREDKYNAKMTIDSFLVRFADMLSAGASLGFIALGFGIATYAATNVGLVLLWVLLAYLIGRENQKRTEALEKKA